MYSLSAGLTRIIDRRHRVSAVTSPQDKNNNRCHYKFMARFEMALHNELFVTLIVYLSCFIPSHAQDYYSITRTSSSTYDVFQVPRCLKPCSSYVGANTHDSSSCKCACKYESSTFGIHNSVWMCQKNAFSRTQAGTIIIL